MANHRIEDLKRLQVDLESVMSEIMVQDPDGALRIQQAFERVSDAIVAIPVPTEIARSDRSKRPA